MRISYWSSDVCSSDVGGAVLAPAAVGLLAALQPGHRLADVGRRGILAAGVEGAERRPGAVDVVHAPAAVPRAIGLLLAAQVVEAAAHHGVVSPVAELRQQIGRAHV